MAGRRWTEFELGNLLSLRNWVGAPPRKPKATSNKVADPYFFGAHCRAVGIPEPVCEYRFLPDRQFRWDYAWPDFMIAVEVEGGIWRKGGGAHSHPLNIERDIEKHNLGVMAGWKLLRYAPEDLGGSIVDLQRLMRDWP
jgi:hypothetical protein